MTDDDLDQLMLELLLEQARVCGSPISELRINTEGRAKDKGCDAFTGRPERDDQWLGDRNTCWQLKAGTSGLPYKLRSEVTKPLPAQTLRDGGRFVVIASASTNGRAGEEDRVAALIREARAAGLPTEHIEVVGSERLAVWCNHHPAIAARWAGRPAALWTMKDWSESEEHQVPWQTTADVERELENQRTDLDLDGGLVHLHIHGHPGVGKTRFALELCRGAPWVRNVIYVRQATDVRLPELIDSATADPSVQLIVVADEVQASQLRPLRDSVGRSNGRIRLITIGHCPTPDPTRIPALRVQPLDRERAGEVIRAWHPAMPPEHVAFVVRFADGYIRLARLAADAVARGGALDVRGLLGRNEIKLFLDQMLGSVGDRRCLHVVAVLASVGWSEDKQVEGEVIAAHLGLEWNYVRTEVEKFHRELGIAPRGGRYRYISPNPLGVHLAVEAWTTYPELLQTLPDVLPSEECREAYYERIRSIASNPQARFFAQEELRRFFQIADLIDVGAAKRWSALSAADPDLAAHQIAKALSDATVEERRLLEGAARREIVWALVRLAWRSSAFESSIRALALLAEAENETWANNATQEFIARFQILLSGTSVPYLNRLQILDNLVNEERVSLTALAIGALAIAGQRHSSRVESEPASDEVRESEWRPHSQGELFDCIRAAVVRLSAIAAARIPELESNFVRAAEGLTSQLTSPAMHEVVSGFFASVRRAYPNTREALRRRIAQIISIDRRRGNGMSQEQIARLEQLHREFEDESVSARLRQYVGQASWDYDEATEDLTGFAAELLKSAGALEQEWQWLTSGEANAGWRLGEALAAVDTGKRLATVLPALHNAGPDLRVLCGYVFACRRELGDDWYHQWIAQNSHSSRLLFEVAWRCGMTEVVAARIIERLTNEELTREVVGQLAFGHWWEDLSGETLESLLRALMAGGHRDTAVAVLGRRIDSKPSERERWSAIALVLATDPELIRSDHMTSYHWKEVASGLVSTHPEEISAAIFQEQAARTGEVWFADFSEAAGILSACVDADPHAVWRALLPHLEGGDVHRFSIGFPENLTERFPLQDVMDWIAGDPDSRASIVARLGGFSLDSDNSLGATILGTYGDRENVGNTFFGVFASGSWVGPASSHWTQLAGQLDILSRTTSFPKLRAWANNAVRRLRVMAERDRHQEDEEDLRRR